MEEKSDPIKFVQKSTIENDLATVDELQKIDDDVAKEIEEATTYALECQEPQKSELFKDVYMEPQSLKGRDYSEHFVVQS